MWQAALPAESAANDDPREVEESAEVTAKLNALTLPQLRKVVGAQYSAQPKSSPLSAKSLRADMEQLAGYWTRQEAAERAAYASLAKK